jgi:hypothetical protein
MQKKTAAGTRVAINSSRLQEQLGHPLNHLIHQIIIPQLYCCVYYHPDQRDCASIGFLWIKWAFFLICNSLLQKVYHLLRVRSEF